MAANYSLAMVVEKQIKRGKLLWRNIEKPDEVFLEGLKDEYGFHELDLEDCLSKTESPKIEEYKDYVFIVFHFPTQNLKNHHIELESLNIFIGSNYLITLSRGRLKKLKEIFQNMEEVKQYQRESFGKGSGYLLYTLMNELFQTSIPYLSHLSRQIREIEEDIFEGNIAKDRLFDIMMVKRQIINLKRAVLPHQPLIQALEHLHKRFISKQMELYFDDVADKLDRIESSLMAMSDTIETLHNANESLTSHNTNRVMKILTIFSVTMLPLTFITGLYGMNVSLPFSQGPQAFHQLLAGMLILIVLMLIFFKTKRWI